MKTYILYAILGTGAFGGGYLICHVSEDRTAQKKAGDDYFRFVPQKDKGNKGFEVK